MAQAQTKKSFIPAEDSKFDEFAFQFNEAVTQTGFITKGGSTSLQSTFTAAYLEWTDAYGTYDDVDDRTPAITRAKNNAKINLITNIRTIAKDVTAWAVNDWRLTPIHLTDNQAWLRSFVLPIPIYMNEAGNSGRHPTDVPSAPPVINVMSGPRGRLILRYENAEVLRPGHSGRVGKKAKPYGVKEVAFSVLVNGVYADSMHNPICVHATKSPVSIKLASNVVGKVITVTAQYVCSNGRVSDFCDPINYVVPGSPPTLTTGGPGPIVTAPANAQ